jgi:hypothetical protein
MNKPPIIKEVECQPGVVNVHPVTGYVGFMLVVGSRYVPAIATKQEYIRMSERGAGAEKPQQPIRHHVE